MKTLNLFLGIAVTISFFLTTGCDADRSPGTTLAAATITLTPALDSPTPASSFTNTPTGTPSPIVQPTATPTPTLTPTATLTAVPTLPLEEAETIILDLLQNNAGCELPCWWGVVPGQTAWEEFEPFLQKLSLEIYQLGGEQTIGAPRISYEVYTRRDLVPSIDLWSLYKVHQGIIEGIEIASIKAQYYPLSQLLTTYGKPDEAWFVTYDGTPDGSHPFRMTLVFSQRGFIVSYGIEDIEKQENKMVACLQQPDKVSLWLVSPEREIAFTDARVETLQVSEEENYRPLDEATDLSIETFYKIFRSSDNTRCLETPAALWDYP